VQILEKVTEGDAVVAYPRKCQFNIRSAQGVAAVGVFRRVYTAVN